MDFNVPGKREEIEEERVEGWSCWLNPNVGWAKLYWIVDAPGEPGCGDHQYLDLKILDEDIKVRYDIMKQDIEKLALKEIEDIKSDDELEELRKKIREYRSNFKAYGSLDGFINYYKSWVYEGEVERCFRKANYHWDDYFVLADLAAMTVYKEKGVDTICTLGTYGYITNDMKMGSFTEFNLKQGAV